MDQPHAAHPREPVHLLELPLGWLAWLILALEKEAGLQAMSSTCHKLHDLVLSQAALVTRLRIETIQKLGTPLHVRALAMAEAATANLHVQISAACSDPNLLQTRWVDTCTRAASLHAQRTGVAPQLAPVAYQLQCSTKITLKRSYYWLQLHLDSLVPVFLVQGCPNLRELTLDEVTIVASPAGPPPPTCTSLQKLTLQGIAFSDDAPSAAVKQQLLNLPSLTALNMVSHHDERAFLQGGIYRAAVDKYSSQLKELEVCSAIAHLPWSPGTQFPHLQHLDLREFCVDSDAVMQQLMQATTRVVSLKIRSIKSLETSFAQEPCSWQELTILNVYVAELAKLPLASCTRLLCANIFLSSKGSPKPSPEQVAAGVAAVQAAGGLQVVAMVLMHLYTDDLQLIPAAGPLLQQVKEDACVSVYRPDGNYSPWSEVQPVLAALGQHLKCKQVDVQINWAGNPGAYAQFVQLLPHAEGFDSLDVPDAEVVEVCRSATRPFTLYLYNHQAHLKQQLEQVQQEAGHQLVTLALTQ